MLCMSACKKETKQRWVTEVSIYLYLSSSLSAALLAKRAGLRSSVARPDALVLNATPTDTATIAPIATAKMIVLFHLPVARPNGSEVMVPLPDMASQSSVYMKEERLVLRDSMSSIRALG